MLFADDISVFARKGQIDECVKVMKEVMSKWKEQSNEDN